MVKLSQKQAAWLIERFQKDVAKDLYPHGVNQMIKIINQCTEKEFPDSRVITEDCDLYFCEVMGHNIYDYKVLMKINGDQLLCYLTYEELKQLIAGCQAICQWLKEQE